jgi:hypothetical protein
MKPEIAVYAELLFCNCRARISGGIGVAKVVSQKLCAQVGRMRQAGFSSFLRIPFIARMTMNIANAMITKSTSVLMNTP